MNYSFNSTKLFCCCWDFYTSHAFLFINDRIISCCLVFEEYSFYTICLHPSLVIFSLFVVSLFLVHLLLYYLNSAFACNSLIVSEFSAWHLEVWLSLYNVLWDWIQGGHSCSCKDLLWLLEFTFITRFFKKVFGHFTLKSYNANVMTIMHNNFYKTNIISIICKTAYYNCIQVVWYSLSYRQWEIHAFTHLLLLEF